MPLCTRTGRRQKAKSVVLSWERRGTRSAESDGPALTDRGDLHPLPRGVLFALLRVKQERWSVSWVVFSIRSTRIN